MKVTYTLSLLRFGHLDVEKVSSRLEEPIVVYGYGDWVRISWDVEAPAMPLEAYARRQAAWVKTLFPLGADMITLDTHAQGRDDFRIVHYGN